MQEAQLHGLHFRMCSQTLLEKNNFLVLVEREYMGFFFPSPEELLSTYIEATSALGRVGNDELRKQMT